MTKEIKSAISPRPKNVPSYVLKKGPKRREIEHTVPPGNITGTSNESDALPELADSDPQDENLDTDDLSHEATSKPGLTSVNDNDGGSFRGTGRLINADLRAIEGATRKGEINLDEIKSLEEVTSESIRLACKKLFFDANEAPKRITRFLSDPYIDKIKELRLLGWYFLEGGLNGRKIKIEVFNPPQEAKPIDLTEVFNPPPQREITIEFPSDVSKFNRTLVIDVIKKLAPDFKVKTKVEISQTLNDIATAKSKKPKKSKSTGILGQE